MFESETREGMLSLCELYDCLVAPKALYSGGVREFKFGLRARHSLGVTQQSQQVTCSPMEMPHPAPKGQE